MIFPGILTKYRLKSGQLVEFNNGKIALVFRNAQKQILLQYRYQYKTFYNHESVDISRINNCYEWSIRKIYDIPYQRQGYESIWSLDYRVCIYEKYDKRVQELSDETLMTELMRRGMIKEDKYNEY